MLMMTAGFSGLWPGGIGPDVRKFERELGQQVSGAFNYCREVDDTAKPAMLAATRIMEELRMEGQEGRLGIRVERDPFSFSRRFPKLATSVARS